MVVSRCTDSRTSTLYITNLTHNSFSCTFISILYMFRASMCPSSGELILSIRHVVYVTLYRWPFGSVITSNASKSPKRPVASLLPPLLLHIPSVFIYDLKNICGSLQCRKLHIILFILLCDLHLFPFRLVYILLLNRACSLPRERPYGISYIYRT